MQVPEAEGTPTGEIELLERQLEHADHKVSVHTRTLARLRMRRGRRE
jgi:hypothetical protein